MTGHADLIKRLRMLAPPNPVARLVLTGDDWAEVSRLVADAERYREFCTTMPICFAGELFFDKVYLDGAIDATRAAVAKGE